MFGFLFLLAFATGLVKAQTVTSSSVQYVESGVPTGTPIPGNYSGILRPQIHFSPPQHFMNDPNGMFIDEEGVYHLYYQYNPTGIVAGNQHWGHATSRDLYHWTNQPIAIYPGASGEGIFSGSAVIDVNNTSGFFPNQTNGVVAIYTLNTDEEQTQNLAISYDGGFTFTKYSGNPVLSIGSTQFRDPKVFWHDETQKWIMVIAYAADLVIGIFNSPDLRQWTHASNFSTSEVLGTQFECPNLVSLPVQSSSPDAEVSSAYVLLISTNPGSPLGGSITWYYSGSFNGTHFTPFYDVARLTDFAMDNYAAQFFYNIPSSQPQISIPWASNWLYAQKVPTSIENWRSTMGVPRAHVLANVSTEGWDLLNVPYGLQTVFASKEATVHSTLARSTKHSSRSSRFSYALTNPSRAFYLSIKASAFSSSGSLSFTFRSSFSSVVTGTLSRAADVSNSSYMFILDRSRVDGYNFSTADNSTTIENSFNTTFEIADSTAAHGLGTILQDEPAQLHIEAVLDRTILEVFLQDGYKAGTTVFYPYADEAIEIVDVVAKNVNVDVEVKGWELEGTW